MFAINPPADSVIEQYLCQKLSLSSPDQVVRTPCNANGYQSAQSSYQAITDEGEKIGIFIKTVGKQANELSKIMDKEILMYETIIPEVTKFVERNDRDLADQVRACFAKYYGNSREIPEISRGDESLFLEDLNQLGNFKLREVDSKKRPDPSKAIEFMKAVFDKLSLIHASFYAWQIRCNPGSSPDEMKEKYPALINYPPVLNTQDFGDFVGGVPAERSTGKLMHIITSVANKVLMSQIGDVEADISKQGEILATMGKLTAIAGHLPELIAEVRNQESQFTCPILGDLNGNNIAVSTQHPGDMIFFDFGLAGFASPLMDVHWFLGEAIIYGLPDEAVKKFLDEYTVKFVAVLEKLGIKLERAALIKEFYATKAGQHILSFMIAALAFFYKFKVKGIPAATVAVFVTNITALNCTDDQNEIKAEIAKLLDREEIIRLLMLLVNTLKSMEDYVGDLEMLVSEME